MRPFTELSQFKSIFKNLDLTTFRQVLAKSDRLRATEEKWFVVNARLVSVRPAVIRPAAAVAAQQQQTEEEVQPPPKRVTRSQLLAKSATPGKAAGDADGGQARYVSQSRAVVGVAAGGGESEACVVELAGLNQRADGEPELRLAVLAADDGAAASRAAGWSADHPLRGLHKQLPPALRPLLALLGPAALGLPRQRQRLEAAITKAGGGFAAAAASLLKAVGTDTIFVCALRVERRRPGGGGGGGGGRAALGLSGGERMCVGVEGCLLGVFLAGGGGGGGGR